MRLAEIDVQPVIRREEDRYKSLTRAARDKWIGWGHRHQYGRLKLVVNNDR